MADRGFRFKTAEKRGRVVEQNMADDGERKKKKKKGAEESGGLWSWWESMSPEVLALIFGKLPADELLRTVPFVCRSWRDAVVGPYCWAEVDIEQWCRRVNRSDIIDYVVRKLVRRSRGTLRRLSAYKLGNSSFFHIANSGSCLKVLQIPVSDVTDQMIEKYAASLATLNVLDISYCLRITSKGIEILGKQCKSLVHLRRNMPPPEIDHGPLEDAASKAEEAEALAVANTMPGLQHLELAYGRFSDHGLNAIITKLTPLRVLDIRGCWSAKFDGDLEDRCLKIEEFRGPWDDDYDEVSLSGDDGENNNENCGLVDVDTSEESEDD